MMPPLTPHLLTFYHLFSAGFDVDNLLEARSRLKRGKKKGILVTRLKKEVPQLVD